MISKRVFWNKCWCFVLIFLSTLSLACGGGSGTISSSGSSTQSPNTTQQLAMTGNWRFVLNNSANTLSLNWAGALTEDNAPTITSNGQLAYFNPGPSIDGSLQVTGMMTGRNTVSLDAKQVNSRAIPPQEYLLTGTMTDDQQHASGTWTVPTNLGGSSIGGSGLWTAMLQAPLTGSYRGTLQETTDAINPVPGGSVVSVTAQWSENPAGVMSGSVTVAGSCSASVTLTAPSYRTGGGLNLSSTNDPSNGTRTVFVGVETISPDAKLIKLLQEKPSTGGFVPYGWMQLENGPCGNRMFLGTLTKN